jgi:hypothetical protein
MHFQFCPRTDVVATRLFATLAKLQMAGACLLDVRTLRSRRGRVTPARRERRAHESGSSSDEDHCAAPRYRLTNAYLPGYPLINS